MSKSLSTARAQSTQKPVGDNVALRIVSADCVFDNRVFRPGDVVNVPDHLARRWLANGRAKPAHLVTVRIDCRTFCGSATHEEGTVLELEEHTAVRLHAHSVGTILEPGQLQGALPARIKPEPMMERIARTVRQIRGVVLAAKGFLVGDRLAYKGDEITMPEHLARLALECKAIELAPGERFEEPPTDICVIPSTLKLLQQDEPRERIA